MGEGEAVTVSDLDVYRSAKLRIDQHGDEAPIQAAMRADQMLERGDLDGQAVSMRILNAVEALLADKPEDGVCVH